MGRKSVLSGIFFCAGSAPAACLRAHNAATARCVSRPRQQTKSSSHNLAFRFQEQFSWYPFRGWHGSSSRVYAHSKALHLVMPKNDRQADQ